MLREEVSGRDLAPVEDLPQIAYFQAAVSFHAMHFYFFNTILVGQTI